MNEGLWAHRHTEFIKCHKILPKSGPLSMLKNNHTTQLFLVKEEKEGE